MHNIDEEYKKLLMDILIHGVKKEDRTGTGTQSLFGRQIRHSMSEGFPLLTTKKMAWKSIVTELIWFLRGDTNIKYLVDNGCNIWNGDAWKNYINEFRRTCPKCPEITKEEFIDKIKTDDKFAKQWGELGPIYGKQWRKWNYQSKKNHYVMAGQPTHYNINIDQIINLISELKSNPDSRRLMVSAWNVGELEQMVLPPCHYGFQVYTKEKEGKRYISAKEVNMIPDEIIGNLGDVHLYLDHIEQAKEQISREPFDLPKLKMNPIFLANLEHKSFDEAINGIVNFELENYQSHPAIKAPLSN